MLPSLSATEPFLWTCVQTTGTDQVAQVLDYFFCFSDRIEVSKTTFAFWRYHVNEIFEEDDIIPEDPAEIALRQKGYPFPSQPFAPNKDSSGGSATRQPERSTR